MIKRRWPRAWFTAGLVGLILVIVPLSRGTAASQTGSALFDPPAVYLTWRHDPTSTMTILWHTSSESDDVVQYRRSDEPAWHMVMGAHHPLPFSDRIVHLVELTDLEPASDYRFRFGDHSVEFAFRTLPRALREPMRFVVGGDMMQRAEWFQETCRRAAQYDPWFVIIGGDIAYADGDPSKVERWIEWFAIWKQTMVTSDGRLIPLLAAIGNHEVSGGFNRRSDQAPFFYSLFPLPASRSYRVLDFGNYMSLIFLDTQHTQAIAGAQTDWLAERLAERSTIPHLFVISHVPAYPSVRPYTYWVSAKIRKYWVPLFEQFGVDVVFEHHDHAYKRTHPILAGAVDPRGIVYLGDGAWGVRIRQPRQDWYLAKTADRRHFILVTLDNEKRRFQAIDSDGTVFDQMEQGVASGFMLTP
ncbi:MAG: metallophosphoesterase family protein [Acidobacteria bacterium]|nr:MAG: metallophosphoesterase family protein [Acidobacteriota bacterium]